jgi:hypothetical protein
MSADNVIWVDFRLSKDIRAKQTLSFSERMKASSERIHMHLQASQTALDTIRLMLDGHRQSALKTAKTRTPRLVSVGADADQTTR